MDKNGKSFDQDARAAAKQAARAEDARRLAAGEITPKELRRENSFIGDLDKSGFRMTAIGDEPVEWKK